MSDVVNPIDYAEFDIKLEIYNISETENLLKLTNLINSNSMLYPSGAH